LLTNYIIQTLTKTNGITENLAVNTTGNPRKHKRTTTYNSIHCKS